MQYQMKINRLRPYALPFDYLITPFESLYALLEHKFNGFLMSENFVLKVKEKEKWIEDMRYATRLMHDFKLEETFLKSYKEIEEKYARRIARFYFLLEKSKKILFIRKKITREQTLQLDELLTKLYPHLDYLIVCLDGTDEMKQDWQLPRIRNFFLRQTEPYKWSGDDMAWKEIFTALGLESMASDIPLQD